MTTTKWNGATADWATASDWSAGEPVDTTFDAQVISPGTYTLSIANGESVTANSLTVNDANAKVAINGALTLASGLTVSAGSIVNSGSLYLESGTTAALVGKVTNSGTVHVAGALNNTGNTLKVGTGQTLGILSLDGGGLLSGGTIADSGSGVVFSGGTLSSVTYDGTLDMSRYESQLTVVGSLVATGTAGIGPGVINETGGGDVLNFAGSQTFDNATINLGSAGTYNSEINEYDPNGNGGTLTLGAHLLIDSVGGGGSVSDSGNAGDAIVNQGTIEVTAGYFYIGKRGSEPEYGPTGKSFINQGTIEISGNSTIYVQDQTFSNTGSISVASGSKANATDTVFTNTGTIDVAGTFDINAGSANLAGGTIAVTSGGLVSISSPASYGKITLASGGEVDLGGSLTLAQLNAAVTNIGGTIGILGTLADSGGTLSVGSGTDIVTLENGGTIVGGVIKDSHSGMLFNGGSLSGVTYDGTLDMSAANSTLTITGSLVATGTVGTGPGVINETGTDDILNFAGSQNFDNATIDLGSTGNYYSQINEYDPTDSGGTLTLGTHLLIASVGDADSVSDSGNAGDAVVNQGTIEATAGFLYLGYDLYNPYYESTGNSFTNQGIIEAAGGEIFVDSLTFKNTGSISVTSGSSVGASDTVFTNTGRIDVAGTFDINAGTANLAGGTIAVTSGGLVSISSPASYGKITLASGGEVDLGGSLTLAQLNAAVTNIGGTIGIFGILNDAGGTLSAGSGTDVVKLESEGTIVGGVIQDSGRGIVFNGGTLSGVTYDGTLDMSPSGSLFFVSGSLVATGTAGTGPGVINETGQSDQLYFIGSQTLDNATVNLGSSGYNNSTLKEYDPTNSGGTLTLGSHLLIDSVGNDDDISDTGNSGDAVVNQGTIEVTAGYLNLGYDLDFGRSGNSFTNQGTVAALGGGSIYIQSQKFTNFSAGTLTGGTYVVGTGSTLELPTGDAITTLAASVVLNGSGSVLTDANAADPIDHTLTRIASAGTLTIGRGRSFAPANSITDAGTVILAGGAITGSSVTIVSGGSEIVSSGSTAVSAIVMSGGVQFVLSGGIASGTTISSGGHDTVTGGKTFGTIVNTGGYEHTNAGGAASGTVISSGGATAVSSGGIESNATLDGTLTVYAGGSTIGTRISSGGTELLSSGGTETATLVVNGGRDTIGVGATGSATVLTFSGSEYVSSGGIASGTVISYGGIQYILSGGIASGTIISSGGHDTVLGIARGTILLSSGAENISSGGIASNTIASSGGTQYIFSGGVATGTIISNGGHDSVYGGKTFGTVISAGGEFIYAGGVASGALVSSGASEVVLSGGATDGALVAGLLTVSAGALASGAVISSGAIETVLTSGIASASFILSGGRDVVSSGGFENGTVVSVGGSDYVNSGGVASGTILNSGGVQYAVGGGVANGTIVSGGAHDTVFGTARSTSVASGGYENVSSGGIASGTSLSSGATQYVFSGGAASGSLVAGTMKVLSGGTANGAVISSGGTLIVSSGGIVTGGLTLSGGTAVISGTIGVGQNVTFVGSGGDLVLDNLSGFSATIAGINDPSQKIDLGGFAYNSATETRSWTQNGTSGTLTVVDGAQTAKLTLSGTFVTNNFMLSDDGHGGTYVVDPPVQQLIHAMAGFGATGAGLVAPISSSDTTQHSVLAVGHG